MPATCTEIVVRLREPPSPYVDYELQQNYYRFRISPDIVFAIGMMVLAPPQDHDATRSESIETVATEQPRRGEMDAYERLLGDAMKGDATLFAREDYVEEAWRIVDPVVKAGTQLYTYEPNTWGPNEVDQLMSPPGGWQNPAPK